MCGGAYHTYHGALHEVAPQRAGEAKSDFSYKINDSSIVKIIVGNLIILMHPCSLKEPMAKDANLNKFFHSAYLFYKIG